MTLAALAEQSRAKPHRFTTMKRIFRKLKMNISAKDLPPPYQENEEHVPQIQDLAQHNFETESCEVLDLLKNCNISTPKSDSEVEYAEIADMGVWHSTPIPNRHKSKISLTWVLKENLEKNAGKRTNTIKAFSIPERRRTGVETRDKTRTERDRVVGRNELYHNLRFRNAYDAFMNGQGSCSDTSIGSEETTKKHRHKHRRRRRKKFGYDIQDLDGFLSAATVDRPGNIPVVIAFPTTLYQTHKDLQEELTLPLGTVVNAVFKNQQWLYVQTPHGEEGYVMYNACLPLGILPNKCSLQKKTPCWESSTDIYPRPCGNLTDTDKEKLRSRTRSESRYRTREKTHQSSCAEKDFDTLYLKTMSVSNIDKLQDGIKNVLRKNRQTLLVINSNFKGSTLNKTLTVKKGEVVMSLQVGDIETDSNLEWFYVRRKDGRQGFIPAGIAGHGYI